MPHPFLGISRDQATVVVTAPVTLGLVFLSLLPISSCAGELPRANGVAL